jgi:hypothetical protein
VAITWHGRARGRRLADLRVHGLVVEDASSGQRTQISLPVLGQLSEGDRYDLALVPVRARQSDDAVDHSSRRQSALLGGAGGLRAWDHPGRQVSTRYPTVPAIGATPARRSAHGSGCLVLPVDVPRETLHHFDIPFRP